MKNITKIAMVLLAVGFLSGNLLAQEAQTINQTKTFRSNWVDADGDGICDNFGTANQASNRQMNRMNKGMHKGMGNGNGMGNGFGNGSGVRPQDGTGFGRKNGSGMGNCDGTGSGNASRRGRRGGK